MKKMIAASVLSIGLVSTLLTPQAYAGEEVFDKVIGEWQGKKNNLNFQYPFKGDIYFGGNTGGMYGKYTHVALARDSTSSTSYSYTYPGDPKQPKQTVSGTGWTGTTIEAVATADANDVISRDVHRFWYYDWAAEGYVKNANTTIRTKAVDKALNYSGGYDWKSIYASNTTWNCTKLVSRAYYDVSSIVLGDITGQLAFPTIFPDHIYYDPDVTIYTTSSAVSEQNLPQHALERLKELKEKGVDTKDLNFEDGIHKKGFNKFIKNLEKESKDKVEFKEQIKKKYQINDQQYNQIVTDAQESTF